MRFPPSLHRPSALNQTSSPPRSYRVSSFPFSKAPPAGWMAKPALSAQPLSQVGATFPSRNDTGLFSMCEPLCTTLCLNSASNSGSGDVSDAWMTQASVPGARWHHPLVLPQVLPWELASQIAFPLEPRRLFLLFSVWLWNGTHTEAHCVWLKVAAKQKCAAWLFIKKHASRSRNRTCLAPQNPPLGSSPPVPLHAVPRWPPSCTWCWSLLALLHDLNHRTLPGFEPRAPVAWLSSQNMVLGVTGWACAALRPSFLLITEWYSIIKVYPNLSIHSTGDGHLSCSQLGAVSDQPAMNIHRQVSRFIYVCISLGLYLGGFAGPWGQMYDSL